MKVVESDGHPIGSVVSGVTVLLTDRDVNDHVMVASQQHRGNSGADGEGFNGSEVGC
ncbi:MAG: hypothetical protein AAF989_16850 [Planctomycetota bacterium]